MGQRRAGEKPFQLARGHLEQGKGVYGKILRPRDLGWATGRAEGTTVEGAMKQLLLLPIQRTALFIGKPAAAAADMEFAGSKYLIRAYPCAFQAVGAFRPKMA